MVFSKIGKLRPKKASSGWKGRVCTSSAERKGNKGTTTGTAAKKHPSVPCHTIVVCIWKKRNKDSGKKQQRYVHLPLTIYMYKETSEEKPVACAPKSLSTTVRVQSPLYAAIIAKPSQKKKNANTAIPQSPAEVGGWGKKNRPSPHNECNSKKICMKVLLTV